ncbi:MAG TPA: chorismate-binding protein [Caldimonas sp.]|nr:chorismate-binding protein [Caldimonas sp.]
MLLCTVARSDADDAEVEAAFARLDDGRGIYFGSDAGVVGLHPLGATLLDAPALAFSVFADGVEVEPIDAVGEALLAHPSLAEFAARCGRATGRDPIAALRAFLAAMPRIEESLLVGALAFDAHRLAGSASSAPPATGMRLGVLFFAPSLLRRDAAGRWQRVSLHFVDGLLAEVASSRAIVRSRPSAASESVPTSDARDDASKTSARDDFAPGGYAEVVARAIAELDGPGLLSLTLSQSFRRGVDPATSPARAFAALRAANPAPASFFVNDGEGERLFGASPDLQLVVRGREVTALPVCGTVARGRGPVGEAEALRELLDEAVDAASLAICSDVLRNDLAPLCVPGTLRLLDRRRPMALATVVHTVDRLRGELRDGIDAWDAIVATAAPVMATGAPRRRALELIAAHEASPRGWYGGLVVEVGGDGSARVGTILRAAALRDGTVEVRTGGDLVRGSDPVREEHESRIKAVSLWRALGLPVDARLQASIAGDAVEKPARSRSTSASTVRLVDAGDPLGCAVADMLVGLGFGLDAGAGVTVLVGADALRCAAAQAEATGLVAIGDAAALVLRRAGFAASGERPAQGELVRVAPAAGSRLEAQVPFRVMRYGSIGVDTTRAPAASAWQAWLVDDADRPVALAHRSRRTVCLLFRPESLLSDAAAGQVLRVACDSVGETRHHRHAPRSGDDAAR